MKRENMFFKITERTKHIGNSLYKLFDKSEYGEFSYRIFEIHNTPETWETWYIDFDTYKEAETFWNNINKERQVVSIQFGNRLNVGNL